MGDVPISATLNNLSDSLTIEDCNYYNDGTHINDLRIQSGVSCSSDGEWIVISKSSSGEQFVFPPNPLCCFTGSDNWEMSMKCKTSRREFSYSNYEQNYVLPDDVVKDQISAKVEDGILTITMPKTEPKEKVTKAIEVS